MSQHPLPAAVPFRARRARLSQAQVRERLLQTGHLMVAGSGLTVGLDHLRYEEAIAHAGVPRSAAYRCFPTKDAFYAELLCTLADSSWAGMAAYDPDTITVAVRTVVERRDELDTSEGRAAVVADACRLAAERNFRSLVASPAWRTYIALNAALLSMPDGDLRTRLSVSLSSAEAKFIDRMASFYRAMSAVLGRRPRPEFEDDLRPIAALGAAVLEGLGLRHVLNPDVTSVRVPRAPWDIATDGDWSLAGIGYTAIIMTLTEPDPNWRPELLDRLDGMAKEFLDG